MLRNTDSGYGLVAIVFHWAIAFLFFVQMGLGIVMTDLEPDDPLIFGLYQWHKSIGLTILLLAVLRLVWRIGGQSPSLPEPMPAWEKRAAKLAHIVLYTALLVVPLLGWAAVSASPLKIPTFAFNQFLVPHLPVPVSEAAENLFAELHGSLAFTAATVALLHIGAALRHEFILRDGLLSRMIRPARR